MGIFHLSGTAGNGSHLWLPYVDTDLLAGYGGVRNMLRMRVEEGETRASLGICVSGAN